jgi:hypothetical protein
VPESGDFEPLIGEIRAIRTFRVGPGGLLYPLFSRTPWQPGPNEAACRLSADPAHRPPEPDCSCGFYAYADETAAREYPFARYALAVVSCWGRVITGTRGLRAQHARIEAIWFARDVPRDLVSLVADQYPQATLYDQREAMLAAHLHSASRTAPPEWSAGPSWPPPIVARSVAAVAIVGGCLPTAWISRVPYGWWLWAVLLAYLLAVAFRPRRRTTDVTQTRHRLVCTALALWLVAPLAGVAGLIFLRLPLIQITLVMVAQRVAMSRAARIFPAPI